MIFEKALRKIFGGAIKKEVAAALSSVNHSDLLKSSYESRFKGKSQPENYAAFMQAYSEEVYVYACVYLIANTIAGLPIKAYRRKANGELEEVKNAPVLALLNSPNSIYSGYTLIESICSNMELTGNAFIFLQDLTAGKPKQIFSLNSAKVKIVPAEESGKYVEAYEYTIGTQKITIPVNQMLHSKYFNPTDDFYGQSSISAGKWAVETIENARIQNNQIFVNGMQIDGSLTTDQQLGDESYTRLLQQMKMDHEGAERSHKMMILEAGLKYQQIGITPRDLDFVNGMKLNREEICAIFGIPPVMVGIQDHSTYNNMKEAQKIFWQSCIIPKLRKLDYVLTYLAQLFDRTLIIEHDTSGVEALKADLKEMMEIAAKLWAMGMPLNQIIADLKLPLAPTKGGNIGYLPYSVMPVGSQKDEPEDDDGNTDDPNPPADGSDSSSQGKSGSPSQKISATHHAGGSAVKKQLKAKQWSPEQKEAIWKKFESSQRAVEKAFTAELKDYFAELTGAMVQAAEQYKSISIQHLGDDMWMVYGVRKDDAAGVVKSISIESVLFDANDALDKLTKIELRYTSEALAKQAAEDMKLLEIGIDFDISNPRTQRFLQQNALLKCETILDNYRDAVKDSLVSGITAGESVPDLIDRIMAEGKQYDEFGAERIARTESVMAANQGSLDAYSQAGVKKKAWIAAMDERTRDTHRAADQRYQDGIPIDQEFEVGGARGMAPASLDLPEESINCRCSLIPIIEEAEEPKPAEGE